MNENAENTTYILFMAFLVFNDCSQSNRFKNTPKKIDVESFIIVSMDLDIGEEFGVQFFNHKHIYNRIFGKTQFHLYVYMHFLVSNLRIIITNCS